MVKSSLPSQKRTLLLVIGLELWVIGIALYALLKERIVPSWDFYLILGGSLLLPIVLYFVLRKRDAIKAKNRTNGANNPRENNPQTGVRHLNFPI